MDDTVKRIPFKDRRRHLMEKPTIPCHSERSEESTELALILNPFSEILRYAQNDKGWLVLLRRTWRL